MPPPEFVKERASAIPLAFLNHWISLALYFMVGVMWLDAGLSVPDRRIVRILTSAARHD